MNKSLDKEITYLYYDDNVYKTTLTSFNDGFYTFEILDNIFPLIFINHYKRQLVCITVHLKTYDSYLTLEHAYISDINEPIITLSSSIVPNVNDVKNAKEAFRLYNLKRIINETS